jgi:DNA polymerase III subunit beta
MNITIPREKFQSVLARVAGIVSGKISVPVLSMVKLEAAAGLLKLCANNLDRSLTVSVKAVVHSPGAILLPAKKLLSIVSELPAGDLNIIVKGSAANLQLGSSKYRLMGVSATEYPPLPPHPKTCVGELRCEQLRRALHLVSHAMSRDETRYVLSSVFLKWGAEVLVAIATDGRRLARFTADLKPATPMTFGVIVPMRAVNELLSHLESGSVKLFHDGPHLLAEITPEQDDENFIAGSLTFLTRLAEGSYPNIEPVIKREPEKTSLVQIPRENFIAAVRRAALVVDEKSYSVKLAFDEQKLVITARSASLGESQEELPGLGLPKPLTVSFNPSFLTEAISQLEKDEIQIALRTETDPVFLESDGFLSVVMPVRTS